MIQYVYVFVRVNMLPVQIAVQACHAVLEMGKEHNDRIMEHPHLLLFGVPDEAELRKVSKLLTKNKITHYHFVEPDMNNSLTAFATYPINYNAEVRKKLRKYKLLPPMIHNR